MRRGRGTPSRCIFAIGRVGERRAFTTARCKGTYVLYSEACAAFLGPKELAERNIITPTAGRKQQSGDRDLNSVRPGAVEDGKFV